MKIRIKIIYANSLVVFIAGCNPKHSVITIGATVLPQRLKTGLLIIMEKIYLKLNSGIHRKNSLFIQ